jgi:hypothetical protein
MMSRRAAYRVTGILAAVFLFLSILPQVFLLQLVVVQRENIDAMSRGSRSLKFTEGKQHLCFVTSIYAAELAQADRPSPVDHMFRNESSPVDFFLFTNLADLPARGWTKIVQTDLPYKRFITHSRWGKFLGWREERLSHCRTVFFSDGYLKPREERWESFRKLSDAISMSDSGLAQVVHPSAGKNPSMERRFSYLVDASKDLAENVKATKLWLQEQPDFTIKQTYYLNKYFGKWCMYHMFGRLSITLRVDYPADLLISLLVCSL